MSIDTLRLAFRIGWKTVSFVILKGHQFDLKYNIFGSLSCHWKYCTLHIKHILLYSILSSDIRQNSAVFAVKESYPGKAFIDKIK